MHSKNAPTLFDNFLNIMKSTSFIHKEVQYKDMVWYMQQAERYVLDKEASSFLGHMTKEIAPLMLRQQEFARAPYEYTWIEIDYPAYIETLDGRGSDEGSDMRVGYFLIQENVLFFISETATSKPQLSPYWYMLHQPVSFQEELEIAHYHGLSRLGLREAMLSVSGLPTNPDWWRSDEAANVCRAHTLNRSKFMDDLSPSMRGEVLKTGAGSLKQAIILLLLLTRPGSGILHLTNQERRHGIIRGKSKVLAPHRKVTIHLNRRMAMEQIIHNLTATGIHHRDHSVRGHWAQTRKVKGKRINCHHDWEPVNPNKYICLNGCGAKRWWKKNHRRGDINLGTVTKEYDVTE